MFMLKELSTSMSVNSVDICLAALRLAKYPPLFISTSVNNIVNYYMAEVILRYVREITHSGWLMSSLVFYDSWTGPNTLVTSVRQVFAGKSSNLF